MDPLWFLSDEGKRLRDNGINLGLGMKYIHKRWADGREAVCPHGGAGYLAFREVEGTDCAWNIFNPMTNCCACKVYEARTANEIARLLQILKATNKEMPY